jgi:YbgC/YbaW family acyl-CoA thioester hydrolase
MPRINIEPPDKFFNISIKIPVRITDINYGGHVGNDSLVSIIHEARVQFLRQHGFTELNIEGVGLIMSNLVVDFKNESFYQDIVEVKMGTVDISRVSFELFYQLSTARNNKEVIIANAKTTMVCYNYLLKKVVSVPQILKEILC